MTVPSEPDGSGYSDRDRPTRSRQLPSFRRLRLTDVGSEVLTQARRGVELSGVVDAIVSNHQSDVSSLLRLSTPPSIYDSLIAPLVGAFQASHPNVRVQIFVSERFVDHIADGVELAFRVGTNEDPSLVSRKILTYRHQLLASPAYLEKYPPPDSPQDLLGHRLLSFSRWKPENRWSFANANGRDKQTLTFPPYFSMNDYAGLASALLAGVGVGELPLLDSQ